MRQKSDLLWPYGQAVALILIPLVWIVFALCLVIAHRNFGWPDSNSLPTALLVGLLISLVPLILRVLDYLSNRRASVKTQFFEIDFSRGAVLQAGIRGEPLRLPANIGIPGIGVQETGREIIKVLDDATRNEIVVVDLEDGDAWYVTRLLALSGGAVRAGSPRVIVFVGMVANDLGKYLGWVVPLTHFGRS